MEDSHEPVDRDVPRALSIAGGSASLADELLAQFLGAAREIVAELDANLGAGDWESLREDVHKQRGAAATCALPRVLQTLDRLYAAVQAADRARVDVLLLDFKADLERLERH